jgi:signal transduction histidine kinase/CheY-like chemotaxis protein
MKADSPKYHGPGITLRTALLSWLITTATVLLFVIVIIPMQKRTYLENLESKARGLAASLHNIAGGATINEDFSSVVDHCRDMLEGDKALDYLVITKNDGFSLINDRSGWRSETGVSKFWRPDVRQPVSGIGVVPLLNRRVFYYSQPLDYSGIQWGWIHVGLSLDSYDRSVAALYERTGILAIVCILISLLASVVYAKHLVQPILRLRQVVRQVAGGNLAARAAVNRGDELGSLAGSINTMTDSLQRRDLILESMRVAAQKFLRMSNWEKVAAEVLAKIGEADGASRVAVLQKEVDDNGKAKLNLICEWESPDCPPAEPAASQHTLVMLGAHLGDLHASWEQGQIFTRLSADVPAPVVQLHKARRVKSLMGIPIMVEGSWWGILSLVDCLVERDWTENEKDNFRAIADMFGAAIERQRIQNALVRAKESAEAASQAKSQFLANMSHEIRTPITGVIGMLQLLQRTEMDKQQTRYAANAFASAKTLLTVIGDVLDFSKIEAGKMELDEHPFDPAEIVDTVVRLFAERAEAKGLELVYRVREEVPRELRGDSNRLRQILVNLVGNAVKFTSDGEVVVACERVAASAETTTLRFDIRDSGCGIPPEKQKLIFDAFSQADNSMSRKYGGTGLGLTISRQFCELMGGGISVQSTPGKGSLFTFTLPFKNNPTNAAGPSAPPRDLRRLRVLVVDDCAVTREINREWIGSWQGIAEEANDATTALEKLRATARAGQPFQVAVLGWRMSGMDGMALARFIKSETELKKTALVLLSSFTRQSSLEHIHAAGFAASVPKPASRSDLYDAIVTANNGESKKRSPTISEKTPPLSAIAYGSANTVLLAEDNEINREVAAEMLAALGYQCRWVRNGREAFEAWSQNPVDMILMDCQMPEMDGYDAARAIRIEEEHRTVRRRVPIVALTAHATKGDRERCLAAGMDDYLAKPVDPNALGAKLAKWIPQSTPAAPSPTAVPAGVLDYPDLLQRCRGGVELAARLVGKLVEQAGEDARGISLAIHQHNAGALAASAHRLKGASANVSAGNLRLLAAELESFGRNNNLSAAAALLPKLEKELERLKTANEQMKPAAGAAAGQK